MSSFVLVCLPVPFSVFVDETMYVLLIFLSVGQPFSSFLSQMIIRSADDLSATVTVSIRLSLSRVQKVLRLLISLVFWSFSTVDW